MKTEVKGLESILNYATLKYFIQDSENREKLEAIVRGTWDSWDYLQNAETIESLWQRLDFSVWTRVGVWFSKLSFGENYGSYFALIAGKIAEVARECGVLEHVSAPTQNKTNVQANVSSVSATYSEDQVDSALIQDKANASHGEARTCDRDAVAPVLQILNSLPKTDEQYIKSRGLEEGFQEIQQHPAFPKFEQLFEKLRQERQKQEEEVEKSAKKLEGPALQGAQPQGQRMSQEQIAALREAFHQEYVPGKFCKIGRDKLRKAQLQKSSSESAIHERKSPPPLKRWLSQTDLGTKIADEFPESFAEELFEEETEDSDVEGAELLLPELELCKGDKLWLDSALISQDNEVDPDLGVTWPALLKSLREGEASPTNLSKAPEWRTLTEKEIAERGLSDLDKEWLDQIRVRQNPDDAQTLLTQPKQEPQNTTSAGKLTRFQRQKLKLRRQRH